VGTRQGGRVGVPAAPLVDPPGISTTSIARSQSSTEFAQSLSGVVAHDPGEMALVDETEIGGEVGEVRVPVGHPVERDGDANPVAELRHRHTGDLGEHAADVKARVTERPGEVGEVRADRVRDDRLASVLNEAAVVGSGARALGGEPARGSPFGQGADEPREVLVDLEPIDTSAQRHDQFAVPEVDRGRRRDGLVGDGGVVRQRVDGAVRQPQ